MKRVFILSFTLILLMCCGCTREGPLDQDPLDQAARLALSYWRSKEPEEVLKAAMQIVSKEIEQSKSISEEDWSRLSRAYGVRSLILSLQALQTIYKYDDNGVHALREKAMEQITHALVACESQKKAKQKSYRQKEKPIESVIECDLPNSLKRRLEQSAESIRILPMTLKEIDRRSIFISEVLSKIKKQSWREVDKLLEQGSQLAEKTPGPTIHGKSPRYDRDINAWLSMKSSFQMIVMALGDYSRAMRKLESDTTRLQVLSIVVCGDLAGAENMTRTSLELLDWAWVSDNTRERWPILYNYRSQILAVRDSTKKLRDRVKGIGLDCED